MSCRVALLTLFLFLSPDAHGIWPLSSKPKSPMAPENKIIATCRNAFFLVAQTAPSRKRTVEERQPKFMSDHAFIEEKRYASYLGKMATEYDPELQTRIFYSATGKPNEHGDIPKVDPDAKALFIYIHGSGTQKASGINFAYKGNTLASMGYAALSFDLPYHFDGPRDGKLVMSDAFMNWLHKLVTKYRVPGQPVYMAGHSFGPGVVGEFATRFPQDVDGVAMMSPAAYNKKLNQWYYKHTSQLADFWGDTLPNHAGSRWAGMATAGFTWMKPRNEKIKDPTLENPNLRVRIMSGSKEEYFPGKLNEKGLPTDDPRDYPFEEDMRALFKNATVTIEPGVGHYIFTHKDANGWDIVLRELLALDGKTPNDQKALKAEFNSRKYSETDQIALKYATEPFFRQWLDSEHHGKETMKELIASDNQKAARELNGKWKKILDQRMEAIKENIRLTKQSAPKFYAENREAIEKLGTKGADNDVVVQRYFDYLNALPGNDVTRWEFTANKSVYAVPEPAPRPQRPDNVVPFPSQKKEKKKPQPPPQATTSN